MNEKNKPSLLKKDISRSFNEAAEFYDTAAFFQREVADRLLERLDYIQINPQTILDLGAGTGYSAELLEKRYKKSKVIIFDFAEKMLLTSKKRKKWFDRKRYICGDAEQLPFADNSFDLIFSNLVLHWIANKERTISELQRVLKPDGLLLFSTLGPDTLFELKQSWSKIDSEVHVHSFIDMHDIGDFLQRASFKDPVVDMEFITLTYNDLRKVLLDLKTLGTHNIAKNRMKGLTGKNKFRNFVSAYEDLRNTDGFLPVTYEVIYGLGWGKALSQKQINEISIPVDTIKRK